MNNLNKKLLKLSLSNKPNPSPRRLRSGRQIIVKALSTTTTKTTEQNKITENTTFSSSELVANNLEPCQLETTSASENLENNKNSSTTSISIFEQPDECSTQSNDDSWVDDVSDNDSENEYYDENDLTKHTNPNFDDCEQLKIINSQKKKSQCSCVI